MSRLNQIKQFLGSFQSRIFIAFTLLTLLIAIAFMIIMANNEIQNYRQRSREKARLLGHHTGRQRQTAIILRRCGDA
jgi:hypothetical protein